MDPQERIEELSNDSSLPNEIEEVDDGKWIERKFEEVGKKLDRITKAMSIIQDWVKKNRGDLDRIEGNFKILTEK